MGGDEGEIVEAKMGTGGIIKSKTLSDAMVEATWDEGGVTYHLPEDEFLQAGYGSV